VQVADFLRLYRLDAELQTLSARLLAAYKPAEAGRPADDAARGGELRLHLRGLVGSQDAVVAAAAAHHAHPNVFVLHDKDEAALFMADLRRKRCFFRAPTSGRMSLTRRKTRTC
jgi:transcription-repair coupling factor (superfamily II helicase)